MIKADYYKLQVGSCRKSKLLFQQNENNFKAKALCRKKCDNPNKKKRKMRD